MLQYFPPPRDAELRGEMTAVMKTIITLTEVTKSVNKNNADHAVLFECIQVWKKKKKEKSRGKEKKRKKKKESRDEEEEEKRERERERERGKFKMRGVILSLSSDMMLD